MHHCIWKHTKLCNKDYCFSVFSCKFDDQFSPNFHRFCHFMYTLGYTKCECCLWQYYQTSPGPLKRHISLHVKKKCSQPPYTKTKENIRFSCQRELERATTDVWTTTCSKTIRNECSRRVGQETQYFFGIDTVAELGLPNEGGQRPLWLTFTLLQS